jgi:uncharacterized protein (DUF433 family)
MTPQLQQAIAATQSIQKTPNVCGGAACIRNTRIPVWVLVQARGLGCSDGEILENYPMLSGGDLDNAWSYASRNLAEIELVIRENDEA